MNTPIPSQQKVIYFLLALTIFSSCQKPLTLSKSNYTQYSIDQQLPVDSSVIRYYQPYKDKMAVEMTRVVGQTDVALTKPGEPETLLGDFFSDAILSEGLKLDSTLQCVFVTKGGLRTQWPKGNITVSHVYELMPFENEMVALQLSGASVQRMLDYIAKKEGQPVAGLTMKIRDGKPYDVTIGGQPFDPDKTYNVLTYDYLADGGDEMEFLKGAISRRDIGIKVRDALMQHIEQLTREGKKITAQLDGRIVKE